MKKGIITKIFISIIVSALSIMPFSISIKAQLFNDNIGLINAFNYFEQHNMDIVAKHETDFAVETPSYYTFKQYEGNNYLDYNMEVYGYSNGNFLGYFMGYSSSKILYKAPGMTGVANCQDCYIKLNADGSPRTWDTTIQPWYNGNGSQLTIYDQLYSYCNGTYTILDSYSSLYRNYVLGGTSVVLYYALPSGVTGDNAASTILNGIRIYTDNQNITQANDFELSCQRRIFAGYTYVKIEIFVKTTTNFVLDLGHLNNKNINELIPVYFGEKQSMPTELINYFEGNTNLKILDAVNRIADGNNISNTAVNNADIINNQFNDANDNFDDLEASFSSDMNNSLNAIDTNLNVNNLSGFVYGANWVKTQFDYIINNYEPIELIVTYSLIIGLAMLLLGKRLL